jgi:WD40 repeat protein
MLWNAATGVLRRSFGQPRVTLRQAAYRPDGAAIATVDNLGTVTEWDSATGAMRSTYHLGQALLTATYSPDSHWIVTAGADGRVYVWSILQEQERPVLRAAGGTIREARYSPDGQRVLTTGDRIPAQVWDARTGQPLFILNDAHDPIHPCGLQPGR